MNRKESISLILLPLIIFCMFSESHGITKIKADHPNFQYTGRIDFSIPDQPTLFWPGTYIKANFEGSLLILMLDDKTGQSYFNVFIDEDYEHPQVIDCNVGSQIYLVSASLKDTVHSLLIFRRTEASSGPTKFLGIQINDGKTLVTPPTRPEHKILFYGNSITCGMGNEAPDSYADDKLVYENNFLAYGAIAARLLNADYMCIAKSGIGIMISWFDMVMSQYYYRLDAENPESIWDFSRFEADVVVVNLFQNDSWLVGTLDSSKIIYAYVDFISEIRNHHPNSFIVCSLGSMDATKIGSPWPGYIESAVEYMYNKNNDSKLGTYFFPHDPNWTKHPRVRHHQEMGKNLSDYIKIKMGWVTTVKNNFPHDIPNNFNLMQNYPNPFNPETTIEYFIDEPSRVKIVIYDSLGREIKTLVDSVKNSGNHKEVFNSSNLSSGILFYKFFYGKNIQTKTMALVK